MPLRINFVKTLWGVRPEMGNAPGGYDQLFERIKREGFAGVETPISVIEDKKQFRDALNKHGLFYVAMINTCRFAPDHPSSRPEDHVESFRRLVREAKEMQPIFINSHSGLDSWSFQVAKDFFVQALRIEEEENIKILHETHRGRILYNPWITRDLCQVFPTLKLTADLSHFCCVAERVFDISSGYDDDWPEILDIVAERTHHIHARVGYAEGPQVPNPAAPEYAKILETHEKWWDAILSRQEANGVTQMTVEPEHGTDGYQHQMPFTQTEVADLWIVNNWIKDRQIGRMSRLPYWNADTPKVFSGQHPLDTSVAHQSALLPGPRSKDSYLWFVAGAAVASAAFVIGNLLKKN
jgi:hypothetical protein